MSRRTGIAWTDATWNPVRGCSRVSEGCRNCYAEKIAARFSGDCFAGFATDKGWTGKVSLVPEKLDEPLRWKRPRRIFVNSMSDLFHESLPFEDIASVFHVMTGECDYKPSPDHTYQILTKRPKQMLAFFDWLRSYSGQEAYIHALQTLWYHDQPSKRVWLGVSVEDQSTAEERLPLLRMTPAAVRFVSYEPALGPVDFRAASGRLGFDWLIIGGESGPGARPCDLAWIRTAARQCREAGAACFVKQLGQKPIARDQDDWVGRRVRGPYPTGNGLEERMHLALRDRKGSDLSEWPEDLRIQEFPR